MKRLCLLAVLIAGSSALAHDHDHDWGAGVDVNVNMDWDHGWEHSASSVNHPDYGPTHTPVVVDRERMIWRLTHVNKHLNDAMARAARDPVLLAMLNEIQNDVSDVREAVATAPTSVQPYDPGTAYQQGYYPPQQQVVQNTPVYQQPPQQYPSGNVNMPPPSGQPNRVFPIRDVMLAQLLHDIDAQSFGQSKLQVLGTNANANYYTCGQVNQVLMHFSFSNDRIQALKLMRPRILDIQNASTIYGSFQFANDRDQASMILR